MRPASSSQARCKDGPQVRTDAIASSPALSAARAVIREVVEGPGTDRYLAPEIEAALGYVTSGESVAAAETCTEDVLAATFAGHIARVGDLVIETEHRHPGAG